ncbi:MAG: hypothetical protein IJW47_02785 [Clostridia bacterium]|nr:hypothetical protein [Clostridia bacterium]
MTKRLSVFFEFLFFTLLIAFSLLLAFGKGYSFAVTDGIKLWAASVLPSLFPYFFIANLLSVNGGTGKLCLALSPFTERLFKTGGPSGYAFFISLISGYPVGAKTVSDLKKSGLLTDTEAVRASAFCSTSSPMFLLSSVGNIMFNNNLFGILLLVVHILSAVITGILFSFYKRSEHPSGHTGFTIKKTDNILYESAYSAVISVLVVGALITIFYLLTEILYSLNIFNLPIKFLTAIFKDENFAKGVVFGLFECTKGLKALSLSSTKLFSLPIAAAIVGFGGLSVIVQSLCFLKSAKIKTAPFIFAKLTMSVISFVLGLTLSFIYF